MSHGWVDYRAVKANVSMEMALATYGIHLHRLDRAYLRGRCPLPTHQSRTSVQSFIVTWIRRIPGLPEAAKHNVDRLWVHVVQFSRFLTFG